VGGGGGGGGGVKGWLIRVQHSLSKRISCTGQVDACVMPELWRNVAALCARVRLAFTRYCYYQYGMLNGKGGGAIYCAILITKYNGGGMQ